MEEEERNREGEKEIERGRKDIYGDGNQ